MDIDDFGDIGDIDDIVAVAEMIERTRYELMRDAQWSDLRAAEREARTDLARRVLETSGLGEAMADLRRRAARCADLEATVAQRDAELVSRREQHAVALAEREGRITLLEDELEQTRDRVVLAEARAEEAESRVAAVRGLLAAEGGSPADLPKETSSRRRFARNLAR